MSVTVMLGGSVEEISPAIETAIDLTKRLKTTLTGLCAIRIVGSRRKPGHRIVLGVVWVALDDAVRLGLVGHAQEHGE